MLNEPNICAGLKRALTYAHRTVNNKIHIRNKKKNNCVDSSITMKIICKYGKDGDVFKFRTTLIATFH